MTCSEVNLQRNSEVYFSTVDLNGGGLGSDMTPANTWRVEVLAGYAFSQAAATQDITLLESGLSPNRQTQRFNTSINPVEWSFTTYLRPTGAGSTGDHSGNSSSTGNVKPLADWFLWQALVSNTFAATGTTEQSVWLDGGAAGTGKLPSGERAASANSAIHGSNMNSINEYNLYFKTDNVVYQVTQASVNEGSVDAAIDSIASTNWSGFGSVIRELTGTTRNEAISVFGGINNAGATVAANSSTNTNTIRSYHTWASMNVYSAPATFTNLTADFIKNRLSTVSLVSTASGTAKTYTFPVTSLGWTYNNGVTFLTPEELAALNSPIGNFTGSKTITGTLTAYLRAANLNTAEFLRDIVSNTSTSMTGATANLQIGGTTAPYVAFYHPKVTYNFPTLAVEDVISVNIEFLANESTACAGDEVTIFAGSDN